MASFLFAAELGAGFGHVAPIRAMARYLRSRGHQCAFAVKDLDAARDYLGEEPGYLLQAPQKLAPPLKPLKVQSSYSSVLYSCGFDEPGGLLVRLRAWLALFQLTRCDYLIADHSPTAVLAARAASLPTGVVGAGFSIPPFESPFPAFTRENSPSTEQLRIHDEAVLQTANQALDGLKVPNLASLGALFEDAFPGLMTYPELDHYGLPRRIGYWGTPDFSFGVDVTWGTRRDPRIFAYLRSCAALPGILAALRDIRAQVVIRVGGVNLSDLAGYVRPGLVVVDRQVDFHRVAQACDAVVNYSGHGTIANMLLAGKPGVLIPSNRERTMTATRIAALGAAIALPNVPEAPFADALSRVIEDPLPRRAAETFAARYAGQDRNAIVPSWCETFLAR